jgi:CobQ-like glutamine amidotransferase family enzyme
MEISILHLYHDLLNLYGESGNVRIMAKHLMDQNLEVKVRHTGIGEEINFTDYDFVYIGSGTEKNQLVALDDLQKYKEDLKSAIDNGLVILATGNSFEIFGQYISDVDDTATEGLKIFNFHSERCEDRITTDIIYRADFLENDIVGFVNKMSHTYDIDNYLFDVRFGVGANSEIKSEGIRVNNFFGTYTIGPILFRNPYFMEYLSRLIISSKDKDFVFSDNVKNVAQHKAYEIVLRELENRLTNSST